MASDDDDFALLCDDAQSHYQHLPPAIAASFSRDATKRLKKGVGNEDDDQGYSASSLGSVSSTNKLKMKSNSRWKRVVLIISGSVLTGSGAQNADPEVITMTGREILMAKHVGVEVALVVGGQNFFCSESWIASTGFDTTTMHQIGMMSSTTNSVLLQASLQRLGVDARVQNEFLMQGTYEAYTAQRAIHHLEKGRVVIFGGISPRNLVPTIDMIAAHRASEIHADAVLKGTNVASAFEHISFRDLESRDLTAMDKTTIAFCEQNKIHGPEVEEDDWYGH